MYPTGWFAKGSDLDDSLGRAVQCALASKLADLSAKTPKSAADAPGDKRGSDKRGGDRNTRGDNGRKKGDDEARGGRKRGLDLPLGNVCGHVIESNREERCPRPQCAREHRFPPSSTYSAQDLAAARERVARFTRKRPDGSS